MTTKATTSTITRPRPTVVEEILLLVEVENSPEPCQGQRKLRKATTAGERAAGPAREGAEAEADEEKEKAKEQAGDGGDETTPQGL